jgi:integrase
MTHPKTLRVGKVTVYLRGSVWYLRYHEQRRRRQVRAGPDKDAARRLAAQVNGQLENGLPAATSFEPLSLPDLQRRWLDHHEHVLRSSLATIHRYRTATDHLLTFAGTVRPTRLVSHFDPPCAEAFVRHLRQVQVAPNGHAGAAKRTLRDKGVKFILEVCRNLFNFALKRRHLPPYTENPFTVIQIERMPVEDAKPITLLTPDQETAFFNACNDWELPIFLTLALTGLRPGELTHLLLPDDLDLTTGYLFVRNKPHLGWQVKTRNERSVPLIPELVAVLQEVIGARKTGPVFLRAKFWNGAHPPLSGLPYAELVATIERRALADGMALDMRDARQKICRRVWTDLGGIRETCLRDVFMGLTRVGSLPGLTAPKMWRHMFATCLQDANVDPLIRNELMGHTPANARAASGLAMTGVYTHSQPSTIRRQLTQALACRSALASARAWLAKRNVNNVAA